MLERICNAFAHPSNSPNGENVQRAAKKFRETGNNPDATSTRLSPPWGEMSKGQRGVERTSTKQNNKETELKTEIIKYKIYAQDKACFLGERIVGWFYPHAHPSNSPNGENGQRAVKKFRATGNNPVVSSTRLSPLWGEMSTGQRGVNSQKTKMSTKHLSHVIKKLSFIISLILETTPFYAQNKKMIYQDSIFNQGVYRTFEEFKYNTPSVPFTYKVGGKTRRYSYSNLGEITQYKLINIGNNAKTIGNVFGFCDGINIYINDELPKLKPKSLFSKIEYIGKYCLYEDLYYTRLGPDNILRLKVIKIINVETGAVTKLDKEEVEKFISGDKELLEKFKADADKEDKIKAYTLEYLRKQNN